MRYLSVLFICLLSACYNPKFTGSFDGLNRKIEFYRGACLGSCPVYFFAVHDNGIAMYKGRSGVEMKGLHYAVIPKKEFKAIQKVFADANLSQYKDNYPANVTDMPSTRITYHFDGQSKVVRGDGKFPDEIVTLHKKLDDLIGRLNWKKVDGKDDN